LEAIYKTIDI